jgi:hypothetical protein
MLNNMTKSDFWSDRYTGPVWYAIVRNEDCVSLVAIIGTRRRFPAEK